MTTTHDPLTGLYTHAFEGADLARAARQTIFRMVIDRHSAFMEAADVHEWVCAGEGWACPWTADRGEAFRAE